MRKKIIVPKPTPSSFTIGWERKARIEAPDDFGLAEGTDADGKHWRESDFQVDHRVYTWNGEWYCWEFNLEASRLKQQAYIARRAARILRKGRPHQPTLYQWADFSDDTRQQRRFRGRVLFKQAQRGHTAV